MKNVLIIPFILYSTLLYSQHNMLGKTQTEILGFYNRDPEFSVDVDTISNTSILITCRTSQPYPFYTYELDRINDLCTSYGFVSKSREILDSYIDILDHMGQIVEQDSTASNFTYKIETSIKSIYYSIKQPFKYTQMISRRNLFYVIVTEQKKEKKDYSKKATDKIK